MEKYSKLISELARSRFNKEFICSDNDYTQVVLFQLLKLAKSEIRIFAGDIDDNIINAPECVEILGKFIENGGKLSILLNSYNEYSEKPPTLFTKLADYISEDFEIYIKRASVHYYYLNDKDKNDIYFIVIDKSSYSIETGLNEKIFVCNLIMKCKQKNMQTPLIVYLGM